MYIYILGRQPMHIHALGPSPGPGPGPGPAQCPPPALNELGSRTNSKHLETRIKV